MTDYEKLSLKLLLFLAMQQAIGIDNSMTPDERVTNSEYFESLSAEVQAAVEGE